MRNVPFGDFRKRNPSLGPDCRPWYIASYCILTREKIESILKQQSTAPSTSTSPETTTSSTSTPLPSLTAWKDFGCYEDDPTGAAWKHLLAVLMATKASLFSAAKIPVPNKVCATAGLKQVTSVGIVIALGEIGHDIRGIATSPVPVIDCSSVADRAN